MCFFAENIKFTLLLFFNLVDFKGITMSVSKIILIVIAVVCCAVGSAGATYYVMDYIKQTEIYDLTTYYQTRVSNLTTYFENEIYDLQEELNTTNTQLSDVKKELEQINLSLQENVSELEKLRSGDKYELHDPTYNEVASFIASDKTDEIPYDNETFDCQHFAQTINDNAENRGIRCAFVIVHFYETNTGHMIVGFNTVDQGMVYIEPQSDEWVENLEVGNEYWTDCVVPKGNYYYEDAPDDTIKEVLVFW